MVIEKRSTCLLVWSDIYFDDEQCFCGRPYISLTAYREKNSYGWNANTISITICDDDDFDIGLAYETDSDNFFNILHELINWMRDHEQGISSYADIWEPLDFFPDCGCKRKRR